MCIMCLSHTVHHQHVSIAVASIFRVNCKNIRNSNSLSKRTSEMLNVTKNVLNFLYNHWILLLQSDKINLFKKHVKTGCTVMNDCGDSFFPFFRFWFYFFIVSYSTYIVSLWHSHGKRKLQSAFLHSNRSDDALSHRMISAAYMKIFIKAFDDGMIRVGSLHILLPRRCYEEASLASGVQDNNFAEWHIAEEFWLQAGNRR